MTCPVVLSNPTVSNPSIPFSSHIDPVSELNASGVTISVSATNEILDPTSSIKNVLLA